MVGPVFTGIGDHIALNEFSDKFPGIATTSDGTVYIAWRGRDNHDVNVMRLNVDLSADHGSKVVSGTTTEDGVALAAFNGTELWVAFQGDDDNLYIAPVTDNGANTPLDFGPVVALGVESDGGPALASYLGGLYLAYADTDHVIHIMRLGAR